MNDAAETRHARMKELFAIALSVRPPDREAWLKNVCAGDAGLREEVELLLNDYESAFPFFEGVRTNLTSAGSALASGRNWLRAKELIAGALERPPNERDAFLRQNCTDLELLDEIRKLIAEDASL